jgi:hypothetical protein
MTQPNHTDTLSFCTANAICGKLLRAGDEIFNYASKLREAGFSAFDPYLTFLEHFCESQEEIRVHRNWLVEMAKIELGTPWPMVLLATPAERKKVYSSAFLEQLRRKRDELNGVPEEQIGERYPLEGWRREVDPARRRMIQAEVTDRSAYQKRFQSMLQEQRDIVALEATQHATDLASEGGLEGIGLYAFFTAVMERNATALGFHLDKDKSLPNSPVFSKKVSRDWDICWELERLNKLASKPLEWQFHPLLEIRHRSLTGSINRGKAGEFLLIRYQHIVRNFGNAYGAFVDLRELETVIKAHLFAYSLMAPIFEDGLGSVLAAHGGRDQPQ